MYLKEPAVGGPVGRQYRRGRPAAVFFYCESSPPLAKRPPVCIPLLLACVIHTESGLAEFGPFVLWGQREGGGESMAVMGGQPGQGI
jgi:hypothetical protein